MQQVDKLLATLGLRLILDKKSIFSTQISD
jgi:hypothetical protein